MQAIIEIKFSNIIVEILVEEREIIFREPNENKNNNEHIKNVIYPKIQSKTATRLPSQRFVTWFGLSFMMALKTECLEQYVFHKHWVDTGTLPEIFEKGDFNFSKTNPSPIVANLFQPLMKMHAIIVKQGFAVIVAFCYNICVFKNLCNNDFESYGFEDCVRENKLPLWGRGGKAPSRWTILAIFSKKKRAIITSFG